MNYSYLSDNVIRFPKISKSVRQVIYEFELDYFNCRKRTAKSETTWKGDYLKVFKNLPQDEQLTERTLVELILSTEPDSKTRKRYCMVLGALAKFAKLNLDLKPLRGKYSTKSVSPRAIPSDDLIAKVRSHLKDKSWQWTYGMLACYGLRPHELFHLNLERVRTGDVCLEVLDGKTGGRIVYPFPLDWYEDWELMEVQLPEVTGHTNSDLGHRVAQAFRRAQMPFRAYDLRHAWAIRAMEAGLHQTLAAQQMGHSVTVHTQVYQRWISEREHRRAYESLMSHRPGMDFVQNP